VPTVDESADGRQIDLPVSEVLEVRLAENPTTGFRWHLVADGSPPCTVLGDSYEASSRRPGAGGQHVWRFRATRPGEAAIELRYARAWQGEAPAGRRYALRLRVT
jgi:inhibitor of cysteine peptidase